MGRKYDPDQALAALAERQKGVVSHVQALACGLSEKQIRVRLARGSLHRVHRGVYAVGHRALTRDARWLAATMACGEGAVLSHVTAAFVWGLRRGHAGLIDVTVARGGRRAPAGVRLHRVGTLGAEDRTRSDALPVTTVARTLFDLATVLPQRALERALEEAEARHLDTTRLPTLLAAHPHKHGAPKLRAALEMHGDGGATLTKSDLEEMFLTLCDDHGLPRPSVNTIVCGYEVDCCWPEAGLVVELDSRRHHMATAAFERDRVRDARLAAQGWRTVRVTYRRMTWDAAGAARDVRAVLTERDPRSAA
jgi:hypothetical protein